MSGLTGNNILAGSSGQGGFEIEQSLRFEDGDSAYMSRTPGSASNQKTWTWSCWAKRGNTGVNFNTFCVGPNNTNDGQIYFNTSDQFVFFGRLSSSIKANFTSSAVYRDVSSWYHIVVLVDTTQATNTDRVKIYINGSQVTDFGTATYPSLNDDLPYNSNSFVHYIGKARGDAAAYIDGYLAEVNFIDGQALDASNFGETDPLTNQWIPKKYAGTYGTNGFYLDFGNSASLGADSSGNGNNFTPTNLAATDQVLDSPTNNFATLNVLSKEFSYAASDSITLSEGNLKFDATLGGETNSTFGVLSGKWYAEFYAATAMYPMLCGVKKSGTIKYDDYPRVHIDSGGTIKNNNVQTQDPSPDFVVGDIFGVALDMDAGSVQFYKNNSLWGSSESLSSVTEPMSFFIGNGTTATRTIYANFGQDSSFAGNKTAQGNQDGNGKGDFYYAPPSGYLALCEDNLSDPSIALPGEHFNTVLGTGTASTQSITGVGFQPDFLWVKRRNGVINHALYDVIRGGTNALRSNTTAAESQFATDTVITFESDGFEIAGGATSGFNGSGDTFAAWNWKANGTGVSNTDGTITSTVSANTDAGFSIISYTGNGTNGATVGHGLSQKPDLVIYKARSQASHDWIVYSSTLGATKRLKLNLTDAESTSSSQFNDTEPTSSVVTLGTFLNINQSSETFIAYCFHSVESYSKFGSYTGNGSTDGPFIYTGFRPAFVLYKRSDAAASWVLLDTKRNPKNVSGNQLFPDLTNAEYAGLVMDILSNGFKFRDGASGNNASGGTYIYMAFAESPFKTSNAR